MSPCHLNARCPRCTARTLTQLSRSAVRCDTCEERFGVLELEADARQMLAACEQARKNALAQEQEQRHAAKAANTN